ncbi:MAG: PD40 domain-containing protein, partial [Acidobacteria bacterium]|nr:PD40 domain-containing protein [Acidobacteriota bacterium]
MVAPVRQTVLSCILIIGTLVPPRLAAQNAPGWGDILDRPELGAWRRTDGRPAAQPPAANVNAGVFQPVIDRMWRTSPTFRRQYSRLARDITLRITIRADAPRTRSDVRAFTRMDRRDGAVVTAEIVILFPREAVELIAHEIEHVIEALDDVVLRGDACGGLRHTGTVGESCRAVETGRQVAREVAEGERTRIVSIPQRDSFSGPLDPATASISANGRFVVFRSDAHLLPADTRPGADLYVLDLETGEIQLASGRPGWANAYSGFIAPRITADGRSLVVEALTGDDAAPDGLRWDIVTVDREAKSARVVDMQHGAALEGRRNRAPAISADGSTVVFESTPIGRRTDQRRVTHIQVAKLREGTVERVTGPVGADSSHSRDSMTPEVSADGRFVAFRAIGALVCGPADRCANRRKSSSQSAHIHVHDTVKDVTTRVTGADGSEPNGPSSWPAISADGRYVAFTSEASNLVENDNNRQADVFLHDRDTGITELVSRRPDGRSGNGPSRFPAISGDGQTVAFQSIASDLICAKRCAEHERDINLVSDVFVLDRKSGTM